MKDSGLRRFAVVVLVVSVAAAACSTSASRRYFGKTVAPQDNVLRYVSGPEPESLDPQIPTGQPEARIAMALFDGLVEYGPKDQQPIPAIAKSWETGPNVDEFIFHLRDNARWSDGTPITADDFVYSLRRGFAGDTLSKTAPLGFFIKYAQEFNAGKVFVKKNGNFLLKKDLAGTPDPKMPAPFGPDTEFQKYIRSPDRVTLDADAGKRQKQIDKDPKLAAAVQGAEFVPVRAEDIGVEAVDKYTLRMTLKQPVPFFVPLLCHQFFRVIPRQAIEKWGRDWVRPEHIVTSGAFKVKADRPYDILLVEKDPNYWDAANVHLDGIAFYPVEDQSTEMNLYKGGEIDAFLNHAVPGSWIDDIRQFKDEYMNFPENATSYYAMNVTHPPFDDQRVRNAFALAIDRNALSEFRKVTKPLFGLVPTGIYQQYDTAREKVAAEMQAKGQPLPPVWSLKFDPEAARKLLTEAGFPVEKSGDGYVCPTFPIEKISLSYNTNEANKAIGEFVQAQWKRNLGLTVPLKNMEFKTFLPFRDELQYDGFAQSLWSGDYMDPYTFLGLQYGKNNDGGAGFYDPAYDKMLDDANAEPDPQVRYEKLARAEFYVLDKMPTIPLTINATNWMKKPYVKGMYPNPGTLLPWKFVYIEKDPSKWDYDITNIMAASDPQVDKQLADLMSTQAAPHPQTSAAVQH